MEQTKTTESELSQKTLIDFLYIDKEKIDSYLSQVYDGTLRSIKTKKDVTQSSLSFEEKSLNLSGEVSIPSVAKGDVKKSKKKYISGTNTDMDATEREYDPYHSMIISLLNFLNLSPIETIPSLNTDSQIFLLKSRISIVDIEIVKKLFPCLKNIKKHSDFQINRFKNLMQ